jgi:hypothetical protein
LVPKRVATPAQLGAVAKALRARRWCPTGGHYADYCIPTSLGECVECHDGETPAGTATETADTPHAAAGIAAGETTAVAGQEHGDLVEEAVARARTAVWRARTAAHDTGRPDAGDADRHWRHASADDDPVAGRTAADPGVGLVHEEVA